MPEDHVNEAIDELRGIVARLQAPEPDGCPWCLAQTSPTLAYELVKEAYEVDEAARALPLDRRELGGGERFPAADETPAALREELGDVLLLIVQLAHHGSAGGHFT